MGRFYNTSLGKTLHAFCVIALLLLGFAHKIPVVAGPISAPVSIEASLKVEPLPDGTLPVLCLNADDAQDKSPNHHPDHNHGCEACRLQGASLLPLAPTIVIAQTGALSEPVLPAVLEAHYRVFLNAKARPRAPPISVFSL